MTEGSPSPLLKGVGKIFLTGGTGFLGKHVVTRLLELGANLCLLSRRDPKEFPLFRNTQIGWRRFALGDKIDFGELPKNAALIHLAWEGLPNYKSLHHVEKNLPASYDLIKSFVSAGGGKVLVSGTCFEYGESYGPLQPRSDTSPNNAYAVAKDSLRRLVELLLDHYTFQLIWTRIFFLHGEGQKDSSLIPSLRRASRDEMEKFNLSRGDQIRDFIHVRDAVQQMLDDLQLTRSSITNICSGEPLSVREFVEGVIEREGLDLRLDFGAVPYPTYEPFAFWGVRDPSMR